MILDIAVLAPITVLVVLAIGFPTGTPLKVALVAIAIVGCFYIGIAFIMPRFMSLLNQLLERKQAPGTSLLGRLLTMLNQLNDAVQTTLRAGVFTKVLLLTIATRSLKYFGLLILFFSIAQGSFPSLETLSPVKALAQ